MTEREKIIDVLQGGINYELWDYPDDNYVEIAFDYEAIADALIKAGIGDVTEYKKTIRDLNTDVVAYRALSKADTLEQIIEGQKSLIDEYKHRAEVAERQAILLSKWLAGKTRKDYPWQAWFDEAQKQAEKEFAEERKDG